MSIGLYNLPRIFYTVCPIPAFILLLKYINKQEVFSVHFIPFFLYVATDVNYHER